MDVYKGGRQSASPRCTVLLKGICMSDMCMHKRCLEPRPKRRSEVVELIPELEKLRCGTTAKGDGAGEAQDSECIVCWTAKKSHLLDPCGHMCVCEVCAGALRTCPLCRVDVRSVIKVYR